MRSIGDRRGLWVFLFLISGLPALFSVLVLLFNPVGALPWVVLTWTVLVVSGYRIWRIDHPYRSARRQIARGVYLFVSFAAGLIGLLLVRAEPMLFEIAAAVWLGLTLLLGLALWFAERGRPAT
jgi:hypothetical protein